MYCQHCRKDRSLWHWIGYHNAVQEPTDSQRAALKFLHERQQAHAHTTPAAPGALHNTRT